MSDDEAHRLANAILDDFSQIVPDLMEDQLKRMQAVIVAWLAPIEISE